MGLSQLRFLPESLSTYVNISGAVFPGAATVNRNRGDSLCLLSSDEVSLSPLKNVTVPELHAFFSLLYLGLSLPSHFFLYCSLDVGLVACFDGWMDGFVD